MGVTTLDRDQVESIVDERLIRLGIDSGKPLVAQQDFHYLRYIRSGATAIKARVVMSIVGALTLGGSSFLWIWFNN